MILVELQSCMGCKGEHDLLLLLNVLLALWLVQLQAWVISLHGGVVRVHGRRRRPGGDGCQSV